MVTLGFKVIVFLVLRNWESLTAGSFGISGIARPAWGPIRFTSDRAYYLYLLGWAAIVVGAAYWGIGGALFAPLLGYIDPGAYTLDRSIQFLMMVVMGGLGRFEGPFIGAAVVTILPEALRGSEGLYLIMYSLAVILMMLFMPKGLVGIWDGVVGWLGRGKAVPSPLAAPPGAPRTS